jgi:DNA-binding transcriptional ArsR family regulator
MDKFFALSAPIRRQILAVLAEGDEFTATAIADKFKVSPSAISQHLKVLLETDLVAMHKDAQQRIYKLNPLSFIELESWAKQMVKQFTSFTTSLSDDEDDVVHEGAH